MPAGEIQPDVLGKCLVLRIMVDGDGEAELVDLIEALPTRKPVVVERACQRLVWGGWAERAGGLPVRFRATDRGREWLADLRRCGLFRG